MNVRKFTGLKRHNAIVQPQEMYAQPECPKEMVWDICNYLQTSVTVIGSPDHCIECPRWETDRDGDQVTRGCYLLAQEACRTALAWQKRTGL